MVSLHGLEVLGIEVRAQCLIKRLWGGALANLSP